MQIIETIISVQDPLYEQISIAAEELQISQSDLFALAMQEYLERRRKQKLLENLNDAYEDGLDASETSMLEGMRQHQRKLMEQVE